MCYGLGVKYLPCYSRKKNGQRHRYGSVAESHRLAGGKTAERQVLYLAYFEGPCEQIPKARHGYSRDGRPDCRQGVMALVVTPDGFPLAYEVLAGNTSDRTTLAAFMVKIESMYGRARRVWLMDRGVPKEEDLARMHADGVGYLVGTPKSLLDRMVPDLADRPWQEIHEGMRVKRACEGEELYVLAQSEDCGTKENAIRRRKLRASAPGLTARETLAGLGAIQRVHVELPTTDGRVLVLPRYTEPEAEQEILLEKLGLTLPAQPPPRIRAGQLTEPMDDRAKPTGGAPNL